jgi:hypothetical protein
MKDTAVKFLIDEISCRFIISEELRIAMYKAIEMEKEQILRAHSNGWNNGIQGNFITTQEYYNETFKSE